MSSPSQSTPSLQNKSRSASDAGFETGTQTGATTTTTSVGGSDRPTPTDFDSTDDTSTGQSSDRTSQDARDALHKVKDFSREARSKADEQWQQARQEFEHARGELARRWQEQRGNVSEKARGMVEQQKERAVGCIGDIASAARAAAQELHNKNDETIAGYADAAASQLEHVQEYLRSARVDDLGREVADFGRRRPEWFLGGAFVVGLAISRFMKASDRRVEARDHLPEGADETLFDDLVEQQHSGDYASGSSYVGGTSQAYGQGRQSGTPAPIGAPPFGRNAPIGLGSPTGPATPSGSSLTGGLGDDALADGDSDTRDDLLSPGSSSRGSGGSAGLGTPI